MHQDSGKDAEFIRPAGLISGLTAISRLLGLVRDAVGAYYFGVGPLWSAFAIGFQVPNLSRRLFGEGALSAAFIPALTDRMASEDRSAGRQLTGNVVLLLGVILLAAVLLGELLLAVWQMVQPGLTLRLTSIMLPYALFICLVAMLSGALQVLGDFRSPAAMPIVFNGVVIGGALAGARWSGTARGHIHWLAGAVLLAGALQVVLQWRALRRLNFQPHLTWDPRHPDIRRIATTMAPAALGLAAVQLNTLADFVIAGIFVPGGGGPAALSYAARLYQLPVGVFGVAIATAIFPQLARRATAGDGERFAATLRRGVGLALLIGVPASVGLWLVRGDAVRVIFEHGRSGPDDTRRIASAVGAYALGIWAYVLQMVLVRAFYARGEVRTPMHVATTMVVFNLILNLLLVHWLHEAGIALATALSAAAQVIILSRLLKRTARDRPTWPRAGEAGGMLLATAAMGAVVWALQQTAGGWGDGMAPSLLRLVLAVLGGAGVYAVAARIAGLLPGGGRPDPRAGPSPGGE